MKKNTQILLAVGALAVVGYFVYKNNKPKKANAIGSKSKNYPCEIGEEKTTNSGGYTICQKGYNQPKYFNPDGTQIQTK